MGTWGYRVLQNDYVLDELYDYFAGTTNYNVELFVNHLFDSKLDSDPNSNHRKLLGVAIVDASINGCDRNLLGLDYGTLDRHVIFFEWLALHPLHNLIPAALAAIDACIANGVDSWSEQSREDRMNLYHTYKNRLSQGQSTITDTDRFKKLFDEVGIKYEENGDTLYVDKFNCDGAEEFGVTFWDGEDYPKGKFHEFWVVAEKE